MAFLHAAVGFSHPFPDVAHQVKDSKWALVKGQSADGIGILIRHVERLSVRRGVVPPGIQRGCRAGPAPSRFPLCLARQSLFDRTAVRQCLIPRHTSDRMIPFPWPDLGRRCTGFLYIMLILGVGYLVLVNPE